MDDGKRLDGVVRDVEMHGMVDGDIRNITTHENRFYATIAQRDFVSVTEQESDFHGVIGNSRVDVVGASSGTHGLVVSCAHWLILGADRDCHVHEVSKGTHGLVLRETRFVVMPRMILLVQQLSR
ncbi:hypothetical protein PanWU01x14_111560 [Parasponia andersonii]|uniref:Uncharacterized protein n=1 Tax=Parasponia andersonii TaxID=3476 RepID=A0A2P5CZ31_PARAD|nr:hypothetical protein PanWU01x14_111560 [Parasponia andersonii]